MTENKTLLQQVREKELDINTRLELASRAAEKSIADAKKECAEMMNTADKEGREAAMIYFNEEKAKIDAGVEAIKLSYSRKVNAISERARTYMPAAVDRIEKEVTMQ